MKEENSINSLIRESKLDLQAIVLIIIVFIAMNSINFVSNVVTFIITLTSLYCINQKKYETYFLILLLSSYHSAGVSIYDSSGIFGVSAIYLTHSYFLFKNSKKVRITRSLLIYFPLLIYIPWIVIMGYLNKISLVLYIKDFLRFYLFITSILIFVNDDLNKTFLKALVKTIIY